MGLLYLYLYLYIPVYCEILCNSYLPLVFSVLTISTCMLYFECDLYRSRVVELSYLGC